MSGSKQGAFVGRVEAALSPDRLVRFAVSRSEPQWERLARYTWNVAISEAFYPLLHLLEVTLRNRVYSLGQSTYPSRHIQHIRSWMDAIPSPLHLYGTADVLAAKKKLFGVDHTGTLRPPRRVYTAGDLIASLDFGFWTGLFNKHYLFQSARDPRLWPHGLVHVFPHAPSKLRLPDVSRRLHDVRHLRNRIFHHEPVWNRPDLAGDRDGILELLDWMSPEVARVLRSNERLTEVMSDEYRRRLRIRIYRESRR
jgi:hypothetical protein